MLTLQLAVPVQAPVHPVNLFPAEGVALNVTWVPALKAYWQVVPQRMPRGVLLTLPLPDLFTLRT